MSAPTKLALAVAALRDLLADGQWRRSADVRAELAARGVAHGFAYRAADICGVERTSRERGRRDAMWRLPPGTPPPDPADIDRRPARRDRPPSTGPARHDAGAICRLCSAPLTGRLTRARYCSDTCKAEAGRLRGILASHDVGAYRSIAERLAADVTPGSALGRLLAAAGLERRGGGPAG